jgi:hypothetical protein
MYSKYSTYRFFTMILFFSAITGIVLYKRRTVLTSIKGSILEEEVKRMLQRNDHVIQILKSKNKKDL